jgi:ATP-dependent DNA ligase
MGLKIVSSQMPPSSRWPIKTEEASVVTKRNTFKSFPDLCATMAACIQAKSAVLDGEIVFLRSDGRPEFYDLMRRRSPQHSTLSTSFGWMVKTFAVCRW